MELNSEKVTNRPNNSRWRKKKKRVYNSLEEMDKNIDLNGMKMKNESILDNIAKYSSNNLKHNFDLNCGKAASKDNKTCRELVMDFTNMVDFEHKACIVKGETTNYTYEVEKFDGHVLSVKMYDKFNDLVRVVWRNNLGNNITDARCYFEKGYLVVECSDEDGGMLVKIIRMSGCDDCYITLSHCTSYKILGNGYFIYLNEEKGVSRVCVGRISEDYVYPTICNELKGLDIESVSQLSRSTSELYFYKYIDEFKKQLDDGGDFMNFEGRKANGDLAYFSVSTIKGVIGRYCTVKVFETFDKDCQNCVEYLFGNRDELSTETVKDVKSGNDVETLNEETNSNSVYAKSKDELVQDIQTNTCNKSTFTEGPKVRLANDSDINKCGYYDDTCHCCNSVSNDKTCTCGCKSECSKKNESKEDDQVDWDKVTDSIAIVLEALMKNENLIAKTLGLKKISEMEDENIFKNLGILRYF